MLVTGAAGQIAYSLIFAIARGDMFGKDQPVILHLLDIAPMIESLKGVVMEIEDTASPLVHGMPCSFHGMLCNRPRLHEIEC